MNCLVNPTDPNYSVAFAVNSIDLNGCPTATSDSLFQDGALVGDTAYGARFYGRLLVVDDKLNPVR